MCFKRFDRIETCHGIDGLFFSVLIQRHNLCPGGGMVDTGDLKSLASNGVPVRVRPWVFSGGLRFLRYVCCTFRALFFEGALVVY
jgi:hypothetical protein